ncbi:MAG: hypothetical protein KDB03_06300 [Planctomycetales bacterium]|nr:hypothetical protein [Planctomycetales bacterium]
MAKRNTKLVLGLLGLIVALVSTSLFSSICHAQGTKQEEQQSLIDRLTGDWVMTGTIGEEQVTHDVYVDRILKRQYIRIHDISRSKDSDGDPAYEAWIHIAWDNENAEYAVMWLDSTGTTNFAPEGVGHGKPDGDRIPFVWKSADGSGIHNTFAYDRKDDSWSWTIDNVNKSQDTSPFARVKLNRK